MKMIPGNRRKRKAWSYADEGAKVIVGAARLYKVALVNLKRGGRTTAGSASLTRLNAILARIEKRHPGAVQSGPSVSPMQVRTRTAGPVVLTIWQSRAVEAPAKVVQ